MSNKIFHSEFNIQERGDGNNQRLIKLNIKEGVS